MPLNKAVEGLSDLLGNYTGGQVTLEASPFAAPAYDVLPFLSPPRWIFNSDTAGAGPRSCKVTVPVGELWLVNSVCWQADLPVVADELVAYCYFNPGTVGGAYIEYGLENEFNRFTNGLAASQNTAGGGVHFDNHLILTSGMDVGVHISKQISAGNITLNIAVQYHRVRT